MKRSEKVIFLIISAIIVAIMIGTMSCSAPWWTGHDNGEAYDHYQKSMKRYIDENGLEPEIYGYGW